MVASGKMASSKKFELVLVFLRLSPSHTAHPISQVLQIHSFSAANASLKYSLPCLDCLQHIDLNQVIRLNHISFLGKAKISSMESKAWGTRTRFFRFVKIARKERTPCKLDPVNIPTHKPSPLKCKTKPHKTQIWSFMFLYYICVLFVL